VSDPNDSTTPQLTADMLLGSGMDVNKVRTIYHYSCLYNALQKQGSSETYFDCSFTGSLCGPSGSTQGNFCLLQTYLPYYLYSDNYTNNINQKFADQLYNTGGSDSVCGLQVKEYDCAGTSSVATAQFGLYRDQTGIFTTAIQLKASPNQTDATYGYAAPTSSITVNGVAYTVCPPGLELRNIYETTLTPSSTWNNSNFVSSYLAREIASSTPASIGVGQVYGSDGTAGLCNGATCTLPTSMNSSAIGSFSYAVPTGDAPFCVIPTSELPST
jgi:hypothetical protein